MRVAIVNDIPIAREILRRVISSTGEHTLAWTAEDGEVAVRKALQDPPDIILMDLVMPVMDGVEATRKIMAEKPCPILLVTSSVSGNFNMVYRAMGYGGLDAVNTPTVGTAGEIQDHEGLLARLAKMSRTKGLAPSAVVAGVAEATIPRMNSHHPAIIAIGASTGGPAALVKVLEGLPADLPGSVVIAQHIAADFAPSLAKWLQDQCKRSVRVAVDGEAPDVGVCYLAGTNDHLVLHEDRRFAYQSDPVHYPYRPSVDVLFNSLASMSDQGGIAVVLTGMGNDGAQGLLRLRRKGWHTIAQDQKSSIVYGMPRAAAELQGACEVLSLEQIGRAIVRKLRA